MGRGSPGREAFGAGSVEASGWLFLSGWAPREGKGQQRLRLAGSRGARKELWETCQHLSICSSFKKWSLHVSYVPSWPPPGTPVRRGRAAPEIGLGLLSRPAQVLIPISVPSTLSLRGSQQEQPSEKPIGTWVHCSKTWISFVPRSSSDPIT